MKRWMAAAAVALLATGCGAVPPAREVAARRLASLVDGRTTREEILLQFGEPTGRFEGDRILSYRMALSHAGCEDETLEVARREIDREGYGMWKGPQYSLVLVFGGDNVLQKHSLVGIK